MGESLTDSNLADHITQSGEDENELDEQGYDSEIYILNENTQVM